MQRAGRFHLISRAACIGVGNDAVLTLIVGIETVSPTTDHGSSGR
jgi:hypothetical protein